MASNDEGDARPNEVCSRDLTAGSISIAVDRLVEKGLVSRVESTEDRGVRISPSPHGAKPSSIQPFESIPGR